MLATKDGLIMKNCTSKFFINLDETWRYKKKMKSKYESLLQRTKGKRLLLTRDLQPLRSYVEYCCFQSHEISNLKFTGRNNDKCGLISLSTIILVQIITIKNAVIKQSLPYFNTDDENRTLSRILVLIVVTGSVNHKVFLSFFFFEFIFFDNFNHQKCKPDSVKEPQPWYNIS